MSLVDLDALRKNLSNDADFIAEMIKLYLDNIPNQLVKLENAVNTEDWREMQSLSHMIKSSVQILGMLPLKVLLQDVEEECKGEQSISKAQLLFKSIQDYVIQATTELETELTRIKKTK